MTILGWVQIALYALVIILIAKPLGWYMTRVFNGEQVLLLRPLRPIERALYWVSGVNERQEQSWGTYAVAMLFFSLAGFVTLYALQRFQASLPFNPQGQAAVTPDLAFNTSVSFITNTNWQSYTPETTMSYLVQMAGLTVHNFLSAATGVALALALIRGFSRRTSNTVGNFWVDMTRCTLYVLLPASDRCRPFLRLAGHAAKPEPLHGGDDARRRQATHRAGAGCIAGSHQDARDEWRRLFQRQLCASF